MFTSQSEEGYLTWLDVSIGEIVSQFNAKLGRLSIMAQNPYNAVLCTGHSKGNLREELNFHSFMNLTCNFTHLKSIFLGIVAMWTPVSKEPVNKMLCHGTALTAVAIEPSGMFVHQQMVRIYAIILFLIV